MSFYHENVLLEIIFNFIEPFTSDIQNVADDEAVRVRVESLLSLRFFSRISLQRKVFFCTTVCSAVCFNNWINICFNFKVDAVQVLRQCNFMLNFAATLFMFCCSFVCLFPCALCMVHPKILCLTKDSTTTAHSVFAFSSLLVLRQNSVASNLDAYGKQNYANYCSRWKSTQNVFRISLHKSS